MVQDRLCRRHYRILQYVPVESRRAFRISLVPPILPGTVQWRRPWYGADVSRRGCRQSRGRTVIIEQLLPENPNTNAGRAGLTRLTLSLAMATIVFASHAGVSAAIPQQNLKSTVQGTVVNASTNEPIMGAQVTRISLPGEPVPQVP